MRLEDMTPSLVRRALVLYADRAWPAGAPPRVRQRVVELDERETLDELLAGFERPRRGEEGAYRRWSLRLGNARYPFMKFVVQEHLVEGEFFFSVDTHDDLEVPPEDPDYAEWQTIKAHNQSVRHDIEEAWEKAELPTHRELRRLAEGLARIELESSKRARILLVDDDAAVAQGLAALLEGRGYQVELAFDGRQGLERLGRDPVPDLVLLDYSMPELSGQQVLRRVRDDPRLTDVPVLLATASSIELSQVERASGLLRKPYPREVLFAMISELLRARRAGGA